MPGISFLRRYVLTLGTLLSAVACVEAQEARKHLEDSAQRLPFLVTNSLFNYDRAVREDLDRLTYIDVPLPARKLYRQIMEALVTANFPTRDLLGLLKDEEPRVRTLALVALFAKEEPQVLPAIYALVDDRAATFGAPPMNRSAFQPFVQKPESQRMPPLKAQTVGDVARLAIKAYLDVANVRIFVRNGQLDVSAFETYWAVRKNRTYCATWFELRFQRATQGISPMRAGRLAFLEKLRQDIERLPPDDRTWTLLWLSDQIEVPAGDALFSVKKLVALCQQLGQGKLMKMLADEKISDDPDMEVKPQMPGGRNSMRKFVLHHACELFDRDAGTTLLKLEQQMSTSYPSPWWSIAAAELQPEKAAEILRATLRQYQKADRDNWQRSELAQALWRLTGSAEAPFLLDWFYRERTDPGPDPHGYFLKMVASQRPQENRPFLAQLVRDPRFEQIDWHTLDQLMHLLNRWSKQPIVSEEEMQQLQHPLGRYHFSLSINARASHPEETSRVLQKLAQWRQKVRDSVPRWNP